MKFPGKLIVAACARELKKQVRMLKKHGKKPRLVAILVGDSKQQLSFVAIKRKMAKDLGIIFDFVHLKKTPSFEEFAHLLKEYSHNPSVHGVLIQQPLPSELQTESIYEYIPDEKEIEGHKEKSPFFSPLGLAVLTALKFGFSRNRVSSKLLVSRKDATFFRKNVKNKRIVLIGRGLTGGQPIGRTLSEFHMNYLNTNSQTFEAFEYYKNADIIITAAGQKVLTPDVLKPGVMLINVGMRKDGSRLAGDYDEKEIKDIASFYTPTPGGTGPIDVLYLFYNLIEAAKMQRKR